MRKLEKKISILLQYKGYLKQCSLYFRGCRGCDRMVVGFTTTYAISAVVSSNSTHGEVYSIQHYVIKFVSDLWQICGFLWIPPQILLTATK